MDPNSHIRQRAPRVLDRVGDVAQEAAGGAAVADPVIERERQLGDLADSELPVDHPVLVDDAADAQDPDLRVVDDRGGPVHPEHAVVVQREGAAAQFRRRGLALADDGGEAADLDVQSSVAEPVTVAHQGQYGAGPEDCAWPRSTRMIPSAV